MFQASQMYFKNLNGKVVKDFDNRTSKLTIASLIMITSMFCNMRCYRRHPKT